LLAVTLWTEPKRGSDPLAKKQNMAITDESIPVVDMLAQVSAEEWQMQ
jgi:hypothetical protein